MAFILVTESHAALLTVTVLLVLAVGLTLPRPKWMLRLADHLATRRRVRRLVKQRPRVEREASISIVKRRLHRSLA